MEPSCCCVWADSSLVVGPFRFWPLPSDLLTKASRLTRSVSDSLTKSAGTGHAQDTLSSMGTKGFRHAGQLPGTGKPVRSSARCIVYDHKRGVVYLSTDNRTLVVDVVRTQRERDKLGEYKAYELAGNTWNEIRVIISTRPAWPSSPPPLFLLLWSNIWSAAFSFLL